MKEANQEIACPECQIVGIRKTYFDRSGLRKHMKRDHPNSFGLQSTASFKSNMEKIVSCDVCKKEYCSISGLLRHKKKKHIVDPGKLESVEEDDKVAEIKSKKSRTIFEVKRLCGEIDQTIDKLSKQKKFDEKPAEISSLELLDKYLEASDRHNQNERELLRLDIDLKIVKASSDSKEEKKEKINDLVARTLIKQKECLDSNGAVLVVKGEIANLLKKEKHKQEESSTQELSNFLNAVRDLCTAEIAYHRVKVTDLEEAMKKQDIIINVLIEKLVNIGIEICIPNDRSIPDPQSFLEKRINLQSLLKDKELKMSALEEGLRTVKANIKKVNEELLRITSVNYSKEFAYKSEMEFVKKEYNKIRLENYEDRVLAIEALNRCLSKIYGHLNFPVDEYGNKTEDIAKSVDFIDPSTKEKFEIPVKLENGTQPFAYKILAMENHLSTEQMFQLLRLIELPICLDNYSPPSYDKMVYYFSLLRPPPSERALISFDPAMTQKSMNAIRKISLGAISGQNEKQTKENK